MGASACKICKFKILEEYNGGPSRYYCNHPEISGAAMICRCNRGSNDITIKTSPKWCPIRNQK